MTPEETRPSPYAMVFGHEAMDDRLFPPIAEEARARDLPLDDPERFIFLGSVGRLLQAIAGGAAEGGAGDASAGDAPPDDARGEALRQHGRLLFHAFHFWQAGKHSETLDEGRVRHLLDDVATVGDWELRTPASSGYLRLPRNLIWAAPAPGAVPEPADGFFWTRVKPPEAPASLHVLLALGVRPDRPGFSVVATTGVLDDVPHWADVEGRPEGGDFSTTLPGGELDRLYSVETAAELLKLASRCFWALDPESG
jgi:hypothetical protein